MPRIKRDVSRAEDQQAAGVYEGPDVPDGTYAGILRWMKYRESRNKKTPLWNNLVILDAKDKDGRNAAYDGFAAFVEVYMIDGSDVNEAREKSLYTAIAGRADVEVVTDDKVPGDPVAVKVGGVSPAGTRVYVQLKTEYDAEYGSRQRGVWIYPDPSFKRDGQPDVSAETDADLDAEATAAPPAKRTRKTAAKKATSNVTPIKAAAAEPEDDGPDYDSMTLPQLRAAAKEAGLEVSGVSKADLIDNLKDLDPGAADDDKSGQKTPADIHKMSQAELDKFLESLGWVVEDFAGMSREDTVELLVEEGSIPPF